MITKNGSQVLSNNLILEIQNRKVEGLIAYSIDHQIFNFKPILGHKKP